MSRREGSLKIKTICGSLHVTILSVLLLLAVPLPAIAPLPIFIAVVAGPLPAFLLLVPVSLPPLIPFIAVGAFPPPAIVVPLPLPSLPLIPLVFFGSEGTGR